MVETILAYLISALVYSLVFYMSKRTKAGGETWDEQKFIRTFVLGMLLGFVAYLMGIEISVTNYEMIILNTGIVGLSEQIIKAIYRIAEKRT